MKYYLLSIPLLLWQLCQASSVPPYDHVVVVIEENHSFNQIIGVADAPYLNSLAQKGALFTNSGYAIHPSQPNYLALFSGSTQGVKDNEKHPKFNAPNIGQAVLAAGKSLLYYSEDLPSVGFDGEWSGQYSRKHNASAQFSNVPTTINVPFSTFPSDYSKLPKISFVVPNEMNDAHTGTIKQMDDWLKKYIAPYADWAVNNNSLLIITFDEPYGSEERIPTLFYGAHIKQGQYNQAINHYSILRLLEDVAGVGYAGASASITPITNVWLVTNPVPDPVFSSNIIQNNDGSATLAFTTLNWQSKGVQLTYSVNDGAQQVLTATNNNNAWSASIAQLKYQDVVTYVFSYEWNGQTKTTAPQQFIYTNNLPAPDISYTQNVQTVGQSVALQFLPSSIASNVIVNYSLNGVVQQQGVMQSNNNVWNFTISNLALANQITYNFTYVINGVSYISANFSYTYEPTPTPTPTLDQAAEVLVQLGVTIPGTAPDYVVVLYAINNGAILEASMIPQCNQWIHLIPGLKVSDQVAYSYIYSQGGQVQTSATYNFMIS